MLTLKEINFVKFKENHYTKLINKGNKGNKGNKRDKRNKGNKRNKRDRMEKRDKMGQKNINCGKTNCCFSKFTRQ